MHTYPPFYLAFLLAINFLSYTASFASVYRAAAVQSPPSSCSFRALLEEEEKRLIKVAQTGTQWGQSVLGSPVSAGPAAKKVTFKSGESSEPERPSG